MMQRRAAFEVKTNKRVGNWSGVGSGKTVSAILSSRVVDARHTLVIAANATLAGWRREIRNAYPGFSSKYTMINYEKFQQPDRGSLVQRLVESDVDFVVLDEVSGLEPFLAGRVDILVGSKPVGTGLDGLQRVSNNLIILSPPWTSAEDEQIRGRLRRQGSAFGSVHIIIPEGEDWSWDRGRWNTIRFKRTLSDCALDGRIPEAVRISETELLRQSKKALEEWIKRVGREGPLAAERQELRIPLPPDVRRRVAPRHGDFSTMNNRWSNSNSSTVEARLRTNPEEWYLYHTLYREIRAGWDEQPAEHIASHLAPRSDLVVGDFGCGECQLTAALPDHKVIGFDYVGVNDTVIEGDMAHTPSEDGTLGAADFSLSLMGHNWRDYLVEANRTLKPFGLLFIAESARRWKDGALETAVDEAGFVVLQSYQRGDFHYVQAVKRG